MKVNEIFLYKVSKALGSGVSAQALIKSTIRDFQISFNSRHGGISEDQLNTWTRKLETWADLSDAEILTKFSKKVAACQKVAERKRVA